MNGVSHFYTCVAVFTQLTYVCYLTVETQKQTFYCAFTEWKASSFFFVLNYILHWSPRKNYFLFVKREKIPSLKKLM
jgi:hypothetical protein